MSLGITEDRKMNYGYLKKIGMGVFIVLPLFSFGYTTEANIQIHDQTMPAMPNEISLPNKATDFPALLFEQQLKGVYTILGVSRDVANKLSANAINFFIEHGWKKIKSAAEMTTTSDSMHVGCVLTSSDNEFIAVCEAEGGTKEFKEVIAIPVLEVNEDPSMFFALITAAQEDALKRK
jgi:hypothetical protein